MCACGRKRNEVVTSIQAAQTETEPRQAAESALAQLEAAAVLEAQTYAQSAAQAARNASS